MPPTILQSNDQVVKPILKAQEDALFSSMPQSTAKTLAKPTDLFQKYLDTGETMFKDAAGTALQMLHKTNDLVASVGDNPVSRAVQSVIGKPNYALFTDDGHVNPNIPGIGPGALESVGSRVEQAVAREAIPLFQEAKNYLSAEDFAQSITDSSAGAIGRKYEGLPTTNRPIADFNLGKQEIGKVNRTQSQTSPDSVAGWVEEIKNGERPPVVVSEGMSPSQEWIMDGHNRLAAYQQLGFKEVPVITKSQLTDIWNKAQPTIYRGGSTDGKYFSTSKTVASDFAKNRGGSVSEHALTPDAKIANYADFPEAKYKGINDYNVNTFSQGKDLKTFQDTQLESDYIKAENWAKQNGYDALKLPTEGEIRVINDKAVQTKSQPQGQTTPEMLSLLGAGAAAGTAVLKGAMTPNTTSTTEKNPQDILASKLEKTPEMLRPAVKEAELFKSANKESKQRESLVDKMATGTRFAETSIVDKPYEYIHYNKNGTKDYGAYGINDSFFQSPGLMQRYAGKIVTPVEVLMNPKLQDQIYKNFASYWLSEGESISSIANMWHQGVGAKTIDHNYIKRVKEGGFK